MNQTLPAGSSHAQRATAVLQMQNGGFIGDDGSPAKFVGAILPRGKVKRRDAGQWT